MIDRLPQLRQMCDPQDIQGSIDLSQGSDGYLEQQFKDQGIDADFFQKIKTIRDCIIVLKSHNDQIKQLKTKYAKAIKSNMEKQYSDQMNKILQENAKYYEKIKSDLQEIHAEVKRSEEEQPDEPQTKMKKNFYISLSKQASQILKHQHHVEQQYKNTVTNKVTRQVRLIDNQIGQQEIQEYINNPALAQQMMERKILGKASTTLKNHVSDIQDKFRDILQLQHSVQQCLTLFNELALLVQAQGERIDNIQANVFDTKDYIEKAQKKLKKAKQHFECSKKCMCCAIVIGILLLIVVIIIVVTTTTANKALL